jgi:hypothetical protein
VAAVAAGATQKSAVGQSGGVVIHLKVAKGEQVGDAAPLAYDGLSNALAFAPPLQAGDTSPPLSRPEPPAHSFLRVVDLLKDFENKNEHDEWPSCTSIACYWCCHAFNGPPTGIPVKVQDGRYCVVGCFCSLECAAKYNFEDASVSMDDMFERYTLINTLAAELRRGEEGNTVVRPAPPRFALTMFGGQMSIDEFRAPFSKFVDINFPPMSALTLQIEEINQSDVMYDFKYIPLDNKRISNYLRRSKPIFDHKNTLDYTMKLKVESAGHDLHAHGVQGS